MIYTLIEDEKIRTFVHDHGFPWEKRRFKPLVFSWLQGKYRLVDCGIAFDSPVQLSISSCWTPLMNSLSYTLLERAHVVLNKQTIDVDQLEMLPEPDFGEATVVRTLSPITMYSTLQSAEGRKITHYYDVRDKDFSRLIRKNLIKKAQSIYGWDIGDVPFTVEPVGIVKPSQEKRIRYKGFFIKAWHGTFLMRGDPRLQLVAYQVGIGGKNAQGFGMLEFVRNGEGVKR
jgi:CRISPR-associated endoribonuclease Cas6